MQDFKDFIIDQVETLDEENVSSEKLEQIFQFIRDYAEDNYII